MSLFKSQVVVGMIFAAGLLVSPAANVTLMTSDAVGSSSFTGSTNWSNLAVPSSGNVYFTGASTIRTTNTQTSGVTYPFAGASLSVDTGGRMLGKIGNNVGGNANTDTISGNFILNGGNFEQAGSASDNSVLTVTGSVAVNAASGTGALGGTANGSSSFEMLNFAAAISGAAALEVSGPLLNAGADTGVVRLSAANPYGGTITVSNGVNNIIASTVNRILQLNNLNALSNATLNLDAAGTNPVSFTAGVNMGPFKLGALAGGSVQALADTAGLAVTISVGGNAMSTAFSGSLTGPGALVKTGTGVLTLAGANTYSGGTTVASGTLQTAGLNGTYGGSGTVVLMAPGAAKPQTVVAGGGSFSGRWVVASGWLYGATNGAFGTNSITINPEYSLDPSAGNPPLAGTALFEPGYDLNSAGQLTLANGGKMSLHQNCAFASVVIEDTALAGGTHTYAELAANFPNSFVANGFGYITVQPFGTLPSPPPQLPQFVTQPVSQTNFSGMTVQFSASAYGYPTPTFQWQAGVGGVYGDLNNGGQCSGVTTSTLTITNLNPTNTLAYVLVASNSSGSVTSTPALLTVMAGAPVITNAAGLAVTLLPDGSYTIASAVPAWAFKGVLGQTPLNVFAANGTDAVGGYSELRFNYTASAPHASGIRLYTNQPIVLFSDTTLAVGANDLAFPHLTTYPANLDHESYSTIDFSPYTFSQLAGDSPWIFFDTNFNCYILSPATNYMVASDTQNGDGSFACGINSVITQLPAGFTHRAMLVIQNGINATFDTWGGALTGLSGKVRPANDAAVELNKLGYWTDNGAAYYYNYVSSQGYPGTMLSVRDQFATNGLPLGYLQLDSWWYPKGVADTWEGDATNNRGGLDEYVAESTLFPDGLTAFQRQLGLPLITHCRWVDGASPYRSQYAMSANVIVDPAYWTNRMAYLNAGGVVTFEHDWLDVNALPLMNLNDPPAFMNDMAESAAAEGINLQYCMGMPRHFLQGSIYNNLLTMRVSPDRFEISKWKAFLYESRFAEAVGAWPWTDVYYSSESRNLLLGTLSGGPVGVGDALGSFNFANLAKSVRPDGVIVKPDVPLTPIDQCYVNDFGNLNQPMVAVTHVNHSGFQADYVFAYAQVATATNASFIPSQLGISGQAYIYDYFNHTGLVATASNPFKFTTTMPSNNVDGTYFVVVPVGPSGMALLGDTNKFVTLGKKRISAMADAGVIQATVAFAPGESNVTLVAYAPASPFTVALNGSLSGVNYNSTSHLFSLNVTPGSSQTATVALSLSPLPYLQITNLGGALQISWPTSAIGYQLENTTTLQSSGSWTPVTNPASVVGNQNSVGVTPAAPAAFYRLKQ